MPQRSRGYDLPHLQSQQWHQQRIQHKENQAVQQRHSQSTALMELEPWKTEEILNLGGYIVKLGSTDEKTIKL